MEVCIDSGPQHTVIDKKQAEAYFREHRDTLKYHKHSQQICFRFGKIDHPSYAILRVHLPLQDSVFVLIEAHIINIDVPFLLGLGVLKQPKVLLDFERYFMKSKSEGWRVKLKDRLGHCCIEWPTAVYYKELELWRNRRHFCYTETDKSFALLKRANESTATTEERKQLEKIRDSCQVCQISARAPPRFCVSMPRDECLFNRHISMDFIELYKRTVLHEVIGIPNFLLTPSFLPRLQQRFGKHSWTVVLLFT